jgi:endonuclease YncB( thermonuclease family)
VNSKPQRDWVGVVDAISMVFVVLLLVALAVFIFFERYVHAAACLSIDVPPAAVIHQPDGDTFHIFSLIPGGLVKIRVQGADTPERKEPKWAEAKEFTRQWLAKGSFKMLTCGQPTLDRIVAVVERNGRTLADDLKVAGLVKPGGGL